MLLIYFITFTYIYTFSFSRTPTQPKVTPEQPQLPPKSVTPAKPSPQPPDPDPWVAFSTKTKNPSPTTSRDPFDFYVDSVRYIPDNASIIKVCCSRVWKMLCKFDM